MTDTTVNNTTTIDNSNTISFSNLWLAMLGIWSRISGTRSFFSVVGLFATSLAAEFVQFPYNALILGVVMGLVPVSISHALEYGRSDNRFMIANLMYMSFYVTFFLVVTVIISSLTMFAAGVFPPVLNIAIGSLIGLSLIAVPFVASLYWHQKGTFWLWIVLNLAAIYTVVNWISKQILQS